jgi:cytochrome c553
MLSRQHTISALALVALVAAGTQASAGDGTKDGKTLYKDTCKSCHLADSPHGEYTPMSLIQDQWRDFFEHKLVPAHENVTDPSHDGKKVLDLLTPDELQILKDWTINHAADSENPMTCG